MHPVPSQSAGQITLTRTLVGRHRQFHTPVVRQVNFSPTGIVEGLFLHVGLLIDVPGSVHAKETPAVVYLFSMTKRHLCQCLPKA